MKHSLVYKLLTIVLVAGVFFSLTGCGSSGGKKGEDPASMNAIETGVTEAMSELPMTMFVRVKEDDSDFENQMMMFGFDADVAKELFVARSMVNVNADCIIVMRVHDMERAKAQLAEFHQAQSNLWENYLPDQFQKVKNNVTGSEGEYLYYVTAGNSDTVLDIIRNAL